MARKRNTAKRRIQPPPPGEGEETVGLRIVGGEFRRRKLLYHGDPRVRPMKDRLRESLFNLVGPSIREKHAVDLFAGTGALAFEALSRGAARATLIECHLPTVALVRRNMALLGVEPLCKLVADDVFDWFHGQRGLPNDRPWAVFCSPPYDFYVHRTEALLGLVAGLFDIAPPESIFVLESDERFDTNRLDQLDSWRVRHYRPAVLYIRRKP